MWLFLYVGGISNLTPDNCKVVLPKTINQWYVRDHQVWEEGISNRSFWLYTWKALKKFSNRAISNQLKHFCNVQRIMRRSWHFVISIVAHVVFICHTFCVCWWQWRVCVCVCMCRESWRNNSDQVEKWRERRWLQNVIFLLSISLPANMKYYELLLNVMVGRKVVKTTEAVTLFGLVKNSLSLCFFLSGWWVIDQSIACSLSGL